MGQRGRLTQSNIKGRTWTRMEATGGLVHVNQGGSPCWRWGVQPWESHAPLSRSRGWAWGCQKVPRYHGDQVSWDRKPRLRAAQRSQGRARTRTRGSGLRELELRLAASAGVTPSAERWPHGSFKLLLHRDENLEDIWLHALCLVFPRSTLHSSTHFFPDLVPSTSHLLSLIPGSSSGNQGLPRLPASLFAALETPPS